MKKRWIALLAAVCMVCSPVMTMAEETDYSYLEDMSVKELKELRDAINAILGDGATTSTSEAKPEKTEITNEDLAAIMVVNDVRENLKAPHSLVVYELSVKRTKSKYLIHFNYAAQNAAGGMIETDGYYDVFLNKDKKPAVETTLAIVLNGDFTEYFAENKKDYNNSSVEEVVIDSDWVLEHLDENTSKIEF